jgi:flagellar M-ring protein FliF
MSQIREWLQQVLGQIRSFLLAMPVHQRITLIGVLLAFVVGFGAFVWWASRPVFDTVFANLAENDAAGIVEYLQAEKVPYRLEQGGRAVLVPAERVHEIRLALARTGLPQGSGVGFEIFDQQKLGMTDFLQRLNYTRALQGELSRTISQIAGVSAARVHLAMPERSVFVREERRPSASVVVTLAAGRVLGTSQVAGIVHLVASSVEGLSPDDVTIVDNGGRVLAGENQGLDGSGLGNGILDYKRTLERGLEERIESMLGRVVGRQKVIARVSAALDLTRVETTEERVDPDQTAVRSERRSREESTGGLSAGGTPGVVANLTNETEGNAGALPKTQRRDESVTYDISKVTSRRVGAAGQVERLSVAVLIDGTYEERDGVQTFVPRPEEELDRYTGLVKNAVGFSEPRGDRVEVASVPFEVPPESEEGWLVMVSGALGELASYLPRLLGAGLILAFFLLFARPALQRLAAQPGDARVALGGEQAALPEPDAVDSLMRHLETENRKLTTEDPERAAYLIRQWLQARD